ncbi:HAD domain-containing protein [Pseudoxanthomonas sp.]|uniref:HAD domain-containing protein n=1 Tax=Pseudoxanthomonas sp. TaxID=1871049 RepID=UPI002585AC49|nr:HAD domain-containing protein [Pseudoxanthomonas sp.]MCR6686806.1 HAD domain-containing protein [Pseudoxanthomonas sp.]
MILFLDFDGVLHPLWEPAPFNDWQLEQTFGPRPWPGPFFMHAPVLVELLGPYLDQVEIVISSTWGRKRDLATLRSLLPSELAARVTDAVHHQLPPQQDIQRGDGLTSRWEEIAFYREHARPDIGDRWLAIDDDDLGWPDGERHHLAHCARDLGCIEARAAVARALAGWRSLKDPLAIRRPVPGRSP